VPHLQRVAVGDAAVADVSVVDGSTVRVKGTARGKTTLLVWTEGSRRAWLVIVR
jgi:Flp pilus assembly secretin CpaC